MNSMTMRAITAVAVVLCVACGFGARAVATEDLRAEIALRYNAVTRAFVTHNSAAYENLLTPDFTLERPMAATVKRADVLADFQRQSSQMSGVKWVRKVTKVQKLKDGVHATVTGHFTGTYKAEGKKHLFDMHSLVNDLWVNSDGTWRLRKSEVVTLTATIDGKSPQRMGR